MSPSKQRSIRLDSHYNGMLEWFAERFERSENEIIRTALDHLNTEYGAALKSAELFIRRLRERHGDEAVLKFHPTDVEVMYDVSANAGAPDPDLVGVLGSIRMESGAFDPTMALYLEPRKWELRTPSPNLYVGTFDPTSAATISIPVADLRPEMQEFGSLLASRGRPLHHMLWGQGGAGRMLTDEQLEESD